MLRSVIALVLAALVSACATFDRQSDPQPPRIEQRDSLKALASHLEKAAKVPAAQINEAVTADQPVDWGTFFEDAIRSDPRLPWENSQAPPAGPVNLADSNSIPPYLATGGIGCQLWNFWFNSGIYSRISCGPMLGFSLDLKTTLVPEYSRGSSTPTFTRATIATWTDFEGKMTAAPPGAARFQGSRWVWNYIQGSSEDLTNVFWVGGGGTTVTGTNQVNLGAGATADIAQQIAPAAGIANHTYVMRAVVSVASGTQKFRLNISHLTVADHYSSDLTATTTPQIFSHTATFSSALGNGNMNWQIVNETAGGTKSIIVTKVQGEDVTGQTNQNPGEYVSIGVLSAPFHGANVDGVKNFSTLNGNTVSSNVVTEATGAAIVAGASGVLATAPVDAGGPFGYYSEAAATQLVTPTADISDMTQVTWAKVTMTTAFTSTGPTGIPNTATRLTASGANATALHLLVAGASSRTYSAYIRRVTGTGTVKLVQNTSKSADLASSLNSTTYTLVQFNANVDVTTLGYGIELGTSGDAIDVWNNQFEAGAFATSPMATAGASRNADVLTYVTSGNFSDTAGTMYAETAQTSWANATGSIIGSATQGMMPLSTNSGVKGFDGTNTVNGTAGAPSGMVKMAVSWTGSTMNVDAAGTAVVTGSYDGAWNIATIGIGTGCVCTIRNARIYLDAMPNGQLQTRTSFHRALMPYRVTWLDAQRTLQ